MASNSSRLPGFDGQDNSGANIGVQVGGNMTGNVTNYFGTTTERPEPKKASSPIHEFPPGSEFFCGREEVLREVEESIVGCEKEIACHRRMVAIIGLGGMGKSEIAKQLARRLQEEYDFIFWFNAQIRTSLESGFERLATILNISLPSEASVVSILPDVYRRLAENYSKAIFIFDNAEQLKRTPGIVGLEEYLAINVNCKKPVFLITSRDPWGSPLQKITCIQLDPLSDEDSYKCILKYMDVEDRLLPTSLKETTASLSRRLGGYPLLLSLVGLTVAVKADKISQHTMESRVKSYVKLLEGQSLEKVCGESKYEETLQLIFNLTVRNINATAEGKIAVELLNIIALLSPDSIHAGLVNGIYCGKPFIPHHRFCLRFVWEDLETPVSMGLKILMKVSLVKIERKTYKRYGGTFEFDMIKVHRLIQKSTQNRLISVDESVAPIEKTIRHFEHNRHDLDHLNDHIRCLLNFCIQNDPSHLQTSRVLMLSIRLVFSRTGLEYPSIGDPEVFRRAKDSRRAKFDPDSYNILCVLEMISKGRTCRREAWSEVKRFILDLSPGFTERRWVIQLSWNALDFYRRWDVQDGDNADLCNWFIQNYKEFYEDFPRSFSILQCLHHLDSSCDWSKDQELISKVVASTGESKRWRFWYDITEIIGQCTKEQKVQLLESLVNCSDAKIFSSSLQFSQDSFKIRFLEYWAYNICGCILEVATIPELRKSLLANKRFIDAFWDIMSFVLKRPVDFFMGGGSMENSVIVLIGTWCFLFHHDVAVYKCFGKKMDSEIQDWLHRSRQSLPGNKWMMFRPGDLLCGF